MKRCATNLEAHEQRCGGRRNDGPAAVEGDAFLVRTTTRASRRTPAALASGRGRVRDAGEQLDAAADIMRLSGGDQRRNSLVQLPEITRRRRRR